MYARIAQFKAVPGKKAELIKGYRDSMVLLSAQEGFKQAILTVDPESDNVISITLWESKELLKKTELPGAYMDHALPYISDFQQARPNFQHYEVVLNDEEVSKFASEGTPKFARIAQFKAVTGKKTELVKGYRDSMVLLSAQDGFEQAVLTVDPESDNVISVTLWSSKELLKKTELPGNYMDHALPYISDFQQARPNFQHYEVVLNDKV